jgi:hypothetical protein
LENAQNVHRLRPGEPEAAMTITVPLTPDEEAKLTALAAGRGVSADALVRSAIKDLIDRATAQISETEIQPDEREKQVKELFQAFDSETVPTGISEGAFHRENWYR